MTTQGELFPRERPAVPVAHCEFPLGPDEVCGREKLPLFLWRHAVVMTLCGQHFFEVIKLTTFEPPGVDYDRQR